MKFLRKALDRAGEMFRPGRPLKSWFPLFEAVDTFLFTSGETPRCAPFVRDAADLKRVMCMVIVALLPAVLFGIYNTGYQAILASGKVPATMEAMGLGAGIVLPIILVSYLAGGFWEVLFACVRRRTISEGFLVTGLLFALTLPATIPLWQVAVGVSFGVVIGKEVFGGTGMNLVNPALAGRAFLFFAYPASLSGDAVWVAVDGVTRATPLSVVACAPSGTNPVELLVSRGYDWSTLFFGFCPGSIGETSRLACLIGLGVLLLSGIASWRIVAGCVLGLLVASGLLQFFSGPDSSAFMSVPAYWHMVLGSFAFGAVFMATDPVSAAATSWGRWVYGFCIGALIVMIRVFNPAYPEGTMLAILLMNIFAPLLDFVAVEWHVARRNHRLQGAKGAR